ncbi:uncharacterized protein EI90DRAFT_3127296 [Cantharellus anzutake]|uniref:uncharacterized protein n=1 Tax=Cantharellus anzutake TaxID=1750568 RepID=UPI0019065070|nr:uncharacterized protein EI90DRAFT_3127296 [Cantharellus anzutake]KAF8327239.1 hypothetical protein EI90DRAFT_3127296 [Cantharellus anzutake]
MPVPFFVYCNSRNDAERSATYLRSRVDGSLKKRIIWVHSGMSDKHKQQAVEMFRDGRLIGITATESLGLGFDLPNIARLVQFGPPDNLSTLAQRFGRAARDPDMSGIVILLAPRDYFEETRLEREGRAKKMAKRKKRKATMQKITSTDDQPRKRTRQLLTMVNHVDAHEVAPSNNEFDEYLLDLHQPDPMLPLREDVWPSSDNDHPDEGHCDLETSSVSEDEMWDEFPDIDFDVVCKAMEGGNSATDGIECMDAIDHNQPNAIDDEVIEPSVEHVEDSGVHVSTRNKPRMVKAKRGPADCKNIDPGLDAFINADLLPDGDPRRGCRRLVFDIYFGNTHTRTPRGCCKWCDPRKSTSCCDLHSPGHTSGMFDAEVEPLPSKWNPQHVGPKSKYEKDDAQSTALDKALYEWRKEEFARAHPDRHDDMWVGDWLILPDDVIDDIIYLAHLNKLTCCEKFIQLVDWVYRERYALELLDIVHKIFPLPPESPTIAQNASQAVENSRISTCSNC